MDVHHIHTHERQFDANAQRFVWSHGLLHWAKNPTRKKKDLRFQQSHLTTEQESDWWIGLPFLPTLTDFISVVVAASKLDKMTECVTIGRQVCLIDVSCLSRCCVKLSIMADFICTKAKQLMFQLAM